MQRRRGKKVKMDNPLEDFEPPSTSYLDEQQTPMDQQRFEIFLNIVK
jgi:hypothetical protein